MVRYYILLLVGVLFTAKSTQAQTVFSGFNYQSQLYSVTGVPEAEKNFNLKFEIRYNNVSGALVYDERQLVTTNVLGRFNVMLGQGTALNNGVFDNFDDVMWKDTSYFTIMYKFDSTGSVYNMVSAHSLLSVPLAAVSRTTLQKYSLSKLTDVDTAGLTNHSVLKWNGSTWAVGTDSISVHDTVNFAWNAGHAANADTSGFAWNAQNILPSDTADFAWMTPTADSAATAQYANDADTATYATTAGMALNAVNTWSTNGNSGTNPATNFIGSTDAKDVKLITSNQPRMTLTSTGRLGVGTTTPVTDFHVNTNNGMAFTGTFGSGAIPMTGGGTRVMWYPRKAAFRGGTLDGIYTTYWNDASIGNYSFAYGYNTRASGIASVAMGERVQAIGNYTAVFGSQCVANSGATYAFVAGQGCTANGISTIALGRGNVASGFASSAIGYHCTTNGDYTHAYGFYCVTNGDNSVAMGYQSQANHDGSFIYGDFSNVSATLATTAANQFMVRAAGGYIFYTSSTLASGVTLPAGSGSWSTLSDSTKKNNIAEVNYLDVLDRVMKTKVYTWNYKTQQNVTHIGPMAQDFRRKFGLGENETTISSVDMDGVNMAAIKGLQMENERLKNQLNELSGMQNELERLKEERKIFLQKLVQLEILLKQQGIAFSLSDPVK